MNIEEMRDYCLSKEHTVETMPFDHDCLVYKVGPADQPKKQKMFALLSLSEPNKISLKCDPERALSLREHYTEITGAYHFNKKYWNQMITDESLSRELIVELIDHSYDLVKGKIPALKKSQK